MESSLEVSLVLLRSGQPSDTIFQGGITLAGQSADSGKWIDWELDGQMTGQIAVKNAVAAGFSENPNGTLAKFSLSGVQIPYSLPVIVGQTFTIEVVMDTYSYVPNGVNGGTQVAMGQPLELQDYYLISSSAPQLPEPATISLLILGVLGFVRRRR
jgi:hypothetical protein